MVKVSCGPGKLRLTLDGVLFDFDRDGLKPGADDILSQIKKAAFDAYPTAHVVVEGHTDNVGNDAHNDDLSARRARTVVGWFEAHGVDASRLASKGFGKRWPRWPNDTEANRAKNRRVELVVADTTAARSCDAQSKSAPATGSGPPPHGTVDGSVHPGEAVIGTGGGAPSGHTDNHPLAPEAFSFLYDASADTHSHSCITTDPSWAPPGIPGLVKTHYGEHDGHFVDHCPTEGLVATCDNRFVVAAMIISYYREDSDALLELAEKECAAGKWKRLVAPAPTPKIQSDTGTYAAVCNRPVNQQCIEARADAKPNTITGVKGQCEADRLTGVTPPSSTPPRCPTQGASGRCDADGLITYYYAADTKGFRELYCSAPGWKWSVP